MNIRMRAGFTVIEVMLFLGVGGLLTAGILVTMGVSLNAQRYKDAVATLQSDIQQQYEDLGAVENVRTEGNDGVCEGARGTSDCVLLGKYFTIANGGLLRSYTVYGDERTAVTTGVDEYTAMRSYQPRITYVGLSNDRMEWGTGIRPPQGATFTGVGVLVLRSPQSGAIHTFTRRSVSASSLSSLIHSAYTGPRIMCVNPGGWTVTDTLAILVGQRAASPNSIEVLSSPMLAEMGLQC